MNTPAAFRLEPSSLTDALYESVRMRIITGDIGPGERLTESRIATEYDVARPTAKACLERLTVVGLLRRSAHKTAVVPHLGAQDIEDLFFSRATVERAAVVRLAEDGTVPSGMHTAQRAIEFAARDGVYEKQVLADIEFHSSLVLGARSERLARMHDLIIGEVHLTMGLYSAHRAVTGVDIAAEHSAIVEAVQGRDVQSAVGCIDAHLSAARDRILARLAAGQED